MLRGLNTHGANAYHSHGIIPRRVLIGTWSRNYGFLSVLAMRVPRSLFLPVTTAKNLSLHKNFVDGSCLRWLHARFRHKGINEASSFRARYSPGLRFHGAAISGFAAAMRNLFNRNCTRRKWVHDM